MIKITWGDDDKTFVIWQFGARWTRDDFNEALEKSIAMIGSRPHTVNALVDMSITAPIPDIINIAVHGIQQTPENLGQVVVVIKNRMWASLYQTVQELAPVKREYKFVRDMEAAHKVLEQGKYIKSA